MSTNTNDICDKNGKLLAYKIGKEISDGLTAYSKDGDFIQTLSWNYNKNKRLPAHIHQNVPRTITHTQECVVVMNGKLAVDIYDENCEKIQSVNLNTGEAMVLLNGAHGYTILENDTKVLEIKNGPYPGAEADRIRIE